MNSIRQIYEDAAARKLDKMMRDAGDLRVRNPDYEDALRTREALSVERELVDRAVSKEEEARPKEVFYAETSAAWLVQR